VRRGKNDFGSHGEEVLQRRADGIGNEYCATTTLRQRSHIDFTPAYDRVDVADVRGNV
jgi:hypothetical protein